MSQSVPSVATPTLLAIPGIMPKLIPWGLDLLKQIAPVGGRDGATLQVRIFTLKKNHFDLQLLQSLLPMKIQFIGIHLWGGPNGKKTFNTRSLASTKNSTGTYPCFLSFLITYIQLIINTECWNQKSRES